MPLPLTFFSGEEIELPLTAPTLLPFSRALAPCEWARPFSVPPAAARRRPPPPPPLARLSESSTGFWEAVMKQRRGSARRGMGHKEDTASHLKSSFYNQPRSLKRLIRKR